MFLKCVTYSEENDCGEPEAPVGSLVSVDDGLASYSCEAGYLLAGERTRVCKDGAWSGAVPACQGDIELQE